MSNLIMKLLKVAGGMLDTLLSCKQHAGSFLWLAGLFSLLLTLCCWMTEDFAYRNLRVKDRLQCVCPAIKCFMQTSPGKHEL